MKRLLNVMALMVFALPLLANEYTVKEVKGTVEVRRGVSEEWKALQEGDLLRPEDTIRTGKKSSARIVVDGKQLRIPEGIMVDISDFRQMSQEEFLLKLAMENILAVPPREDGSIAIPRTTVIHGTEAKETTDEQVKVEPGIMQLQGAKLLYENQFYATSVLKTKATFRVYPSLQANVDARMRVANAFETMKLTNEALTEYSRMLSEELSAQQKTTVQKSVERIRNTQNTR